MILKCLIPKLRTFVEKGNLCISAMDTRPKLNVCESIICFHGHGMNVLCSFNLGCV